MDKKPHRSSRELPREVYEVDCQSTGSRTRSNVLKELILKELRAK